MQVPLLKVCFSTYKSSSERCEPRAVAAFLGFGTLLAGAFAAFSPGTDVPFGTEGIAVVAGALSVCACSLVFIPTAISLFCSALEAAAVVAVMQFGTTAVSLPRCCLTIEVSKEALNNFVSIFKLCTYHKGCRYVHYIDLHIDVSFSECMGFERVEIVVCEFLR